jgi:hypothetical protein
MKGSIPLLVALAVLLASSPRGSAQSVKHSENPQVQFRFQPNPSSSFLLNRSSLFGSSSAWAGAMPLVNVLPLSSHRFRSPGFPFWGQGRRSQVRPFNFSPLQPYPFFSSYNTYGYYGGPTDSESNGVKSFIEQWGNRNPFASNPSLTLSGSSLLSPGMTEEEVTRHLGSPIDKFSSGGVQIWKYSGFSLRFKDDKLEGLQ